MAPQGQTQSVEPFPNGNVQSALTLTKQGILYSRSYATREYMTEYLGEPVFEDENCVVFADERGDTWDEFLNYFGAKGLSTAVASDALYEVAESRSGTEEWGESYPIPIDKRSEGFGEE